jgi:hypothetical protein
MKALILVLAIVGSSALFSGCDLLEKADDVSFDAVITVNWTADENGDGTNVPYVDEELVQLSSDPEVAKYINKIKTVKINKITYSVTDYNAAPHNSQVIFNNGVASFYAAGNSIPLVAVPYAAAATGVNLQTSTAETELTIDDDGLSKIADAFKKDKQLEYASEGTLSVTPVSFKVISKFYVTITANALD